MTVFWFSIVNYYRVYLDVEPKRIILNAANAELAEKTAKLADVRARVAKLEADRDKLVQQLNVANAERAKTSAEYEATNRIIILANRLSKAI